MDNINLISSKVHIFYLTVAFSFDLHNLHIFIHANLHRGIGLDLLRASSIKITASQHDLTKKSEDAYERTIKRVTVHPDYVCNKPNNDIAILELGEKLIWSGTVSPACLPMSTSGLEDDSIDNLLATVAGWGWTNELSSKGKKILLEVDFVGRTIYSSSLKKFC